MASPTPPRKQGLYDPAFEHDACGIGAVVRISGQADHSIVEMGKSVLLNLQHRGAAGSDESTGDGAGILTQIPHALLAAESGLGLDKGHSQKLPPPGRYGVGMVFTPRDEPAARACQVFLQQAAANCGLEVLGWRRVPTDAQTLGDLARQCEPGVWQVFVDARGLAGEELERRLYLTRRRAEKLARQKMGPAARDFYICSLSARTIVYKGMFLAPQLFAYYPDLGDERFTSALAIVHQRYSTNTFPSWKLAQPFRIVSHNGEINTLRGNVNRMRARETQMESELLEDLSDVVPVLEEGGSDSAQFDNVLELLVRAGRSLPHAMMMMVPEAFGALYHISTDKRAFYEYHAAIMEPWDGPAAMVFTDGRLVGGTLDRNGLRPARYVLTTDGLVVLASEVGVVDLPPERIQQKGRLQPGKMFLVDLEEGRIVVDNEIKSKIARQKPYRRWLEQNRIELRGLFTNTPTAGGKCLPMEERLRLFGYTRDELGTILAPMAVNGQEPVGSMGTDTPLAVLSQKNRLLFDYFKQLFAQVTNPPIDPLREGLVMSLMSFTGRQHNLLAESPEHCRQLKLPHPILTPEELQRLRSAGRKDFAVVTLDATFDPAAVDGGAALKKALAEMVDAAEKAIEQGASLLIVSDRAASPTRAPIPSLLAVGALQHGLLDRELRGQAGIIVESGEPREVMHFCLLCGYGANAVSPYLALESLEWLRGRGELGEEPLQSEQLIDNYITAVKKGILKTISKMGISTLRSYHGAQLFEAVGLSRALVDAYFTGTPTRIEGVGLDALAREAIERHRRAFAPRPPGAMELDFGGEYAFRKDGENHLWNPQTITLLQQAVRRDDAAAYEQYSKLVNDQSRTHYTLRGLMEFVPGEAVPLEEVEPASEIVKRFVTGAMSHGSISKEAHETMAAAMNALSSMSNTGEGGEDPARYQVRGDGLDLNCGIKQVASGRFGVTLDYLSHAKFLQIKMAQGAKPGEGGQLPGHKVTKEIALLRHSTPGVSLISPPPHHDIYSIEDLAQLIYDLKCVTGGSGDASRGEGILPSRLAGVSPASVSSSSSAAAVSVASSSGAVSSEQKAETEVETTEGKMPSGREGGTPSPRQTPRVKISVKLVSEVGVGTVAAGVAKGGADEVLISGYDGGTGASPLSSIKHAGVPWELGLAETQQTLLLNGLRDRILVQADGQMKTGRDVVVAALLGAERFGFGTAALVSLGCIMMRKCHQGTCPVGIGTQDEKLRKRFAGRPEHLRRFLLFVAEEVRRRMAELGFRRFEDMIGHVEKLAARKAVEHYKAKGLDFSNLFARPAVAPGASLRCVRGQPDVTAGHLDWEIIEKAQAVLTPGEGTGDRKNGDCTRFPSSENGGCPRFSGKSADSPDSQQKNGDRHDFQKTENGASPHFSSPHFSVELPIRNVNRTVGAILSHTIEKRFGAAGLPDGSLEVVLRGSAGQSFGAFLAPGVTLRLIGDANDYLGKGLSGGRIVVQAPENAAFEPGENIIAGNTLLYGATAGEAFVNGLAGERFAVRNSGVTAVVEGVGDHGCEYMTGGTVVVLGATGRNFAAGMSGGVAYVLDEHQLFDTLCNLDTVDLEVVWQEEDQVILRDLISRHARWTASARARRILDRWPEMVGRFVKVMPIDYRKAMERLREQERRGEEFSPATEEVFRG